MAKVAGMAGRVMHALTTLTPLNFLFFLYLAAVSYVNSSFLGRFFSSFGISLFFAVQAALTVAALSVMPRLVTRYGARNVLIFLTPVTSAAALFLGLSETGIAALSFFFIQGVGIYCLMYLLDLYLESVVKDESMTGNVRGIFLTSGNLAIFLSPFAISLLVVGDAYAPLFAFAAAVLIPALVIAMTALRKLTPVAPKGHSFREALTELWHSRPSVAKVIGAYLLLWIFYSWVVIYTPLLLIQAGGYSWQVVGLVTAFALLPFLLLEVPLGIAADRWLGEKEIMAAGFLILAGATALLGLVPTGMLLMWAFVLFATRVGAAMVEISTETYFFKQVSEKDAALVSLFRMTRSLGFLVGPVIALAFFPVTGLQHLFVAFGIVLFLGVPLALGIIDTK